MPKIVGYVGEAPPTEERGFPWMSVALVGAGVTVMLWLASHADGDGDLDLVPNEGDDEDEDEDEDEGDDEDEGEGKDEAAPEPEAKADAKPRLKIKRISEFSPETLTKIRTRIEAARSGDETAKPSPQLMEEIASIGVIQDIAKLPPGRYTFDLDPAFEERPRKWKRNRWRRYKDTTTLRGAFYSSRLAAAGSDSPHVFLDTKGSATGNAEQPYKPASPVVLGIYREDGQPVFLIYGNQTPPLPMETDREKRRTSFAKTQERRQAREQARRGKDDLQQTRAQARAEERAARAENRLGKAIKKYEERAKVATKKISQQLDAKIREAREAREALAAEKAEVRKRRTSKKAVEVVEFDGPQEYIDFWKETIDAVAQTGAGFPENTAEGTISTRVAIDEENNKYRNADFGLEESVSVYDVEDLLPRINDRIRVTFDPDRNVVIWSIAQRAPVQRRQAEEGEQGEQGDGEETPASDSFDYRPNEDYGWTWVLETIIEADRVGVKNPPNQLTGIIVSEEKEGSEDQKTATGEAANYFEVNFGSQSAPIIKNVDWSDIYKLKPFVGETLVVSLTKLEDGGYRVTYTIPREPPKKRRKKSGGGGGGGGGGASSGESKKARTPLVMIEGGGGAPTSPEEGKATKPQLVGIEGGRGSKKTSRPQAEPPAEGGTAEAAGEEVAFAEPTTEGSGSVVAPTGVQEVDEIKEEEGAEEGEKAEEGEEPGPASAPALKPSSGAVPAKTSRRKKTSKETESGAAAATAALAEQLAQRIKRYKTLAALVEDQPKIFAELKKLNFDQKSIDDAWMSAVKERQRLEELAQVEAEEARVAAMTPMELQAYLERFRAEAAARVPVQRAEKEKERQEGIARGFAQWFTERLTELEEKAAKLKRAKFEREPFPSFFARIVAFTSDRKYALFQFDLDDSGDRTGLVARLPEAFVTSQPPDGLGIPPRVGELIQFIGFLGEQGKVNLVIARPISEIEAKSEGLPPVLSPPSEQSVKLSPGVPEEGVYYAIGITKREGYAAVDESGKLRFLMELPFKNARKKPNYGFFRSYVYLTPTEDGVTFEVRDADQSEIRGSGILRYQNAMSGHVANVVDGFNGHTFTANWFKTRLEAIIDSLATRRSLALERGADREGSGPVELEYKIQHYERLLRLGTNVRMPIDGVLTTIKVPISELEAKLVRVPTENEFAQVTGTGTIEISGSQSKVNADFILMNRLKLGDTFKIWPRWDAQARNVTAAEVVVVGKEFKEKPTYFQFVDKLAQQSVEDWLDQYWFAEYVKKVRKYINTAGKQPEDLKNTTITDALFSLRGKIMEPAEDHFYKVKFDHGSESLPDSLFGVDESGAYGMLKKGAEFEIRARVQGGKYIDPQVIVKSSSPKKTRGGSKKMDKNSQASDRDPALYREFRRTINMSSAEIERWRRNPQHRDASLPHIRAELPLLAQMKRTPMSRWTPRMWNKAMRAVNFVKRHEAQMKVQAKRYGSGRLHVTYKRIIGLLNWGRKTPGVSISKVLSSKLKANSGARKTSKSSKRRTSRRNPSGMR